MRTRKKRNSSSGETPQSPLSNTVQTAKKKVEISLDTDGETRIQGHGIFDQVPTYIPAEDSTLPSQRESLDSEKRVFAMKNGNQKLQLTLKERKAENIYVAERQDGEKVVLKVDDVPPTLAKTLDDEVMSSDLTGGNVQNLAETVSLIRADHERIPSLRGVIEGRNAIAQVQDHYAAPTAKEWHKQDVVGKLLDEDQLLAFLESTYDMLSHCHSENEGRGTAFAHRDISPNNILVDEQEDGLETMLIDFDHSNPTDTVQTANAYGTPGHWAPEQIRGKITEKSDVYSAATVGLYLAVGEERYEELLPDMFPKTPVDTDKMNYLLEDRYTQPTISLLENALAEEPEDRPQSRDFLEKVQLVQNTGRYHQSDLPSTPTTFDPSAYEQKEKIETNINNKEIGMISSLGSFAASSSTFLAMLASGMSGPLTNVALPLMTILSLPFFGSYADRFNKLSDYKNTVENHLEDHCWKRAGQQARSAAPLRAEKILLSYRSRIGSVVDYPVGAFRQGFGLPKQYEILNIEQGDAETAYAGDLDEHLYTRFRMKELEERDLLPAAQVLN